MSIDPYARTTTPYFCLWCTKRSAFPLEHKTLGFVCQHCLRPFGPVRKARPAPQSTVRQTYYPDAARRQKKPRHKPRMSPPLLAAAERDGWVCWLCGERVDRPGVGPFEHRASLDHVQRRRDGGTRDPANVRLAHQSCNEYREGANVRPFAPPLQQIRVSPVPYPGGER